MTLKDELAKKREESPNAPYMLFVTRYRPDAKTNHVFVESNDDVGFYSLCIERAGSYKTDFVPCNGKGGVLRVRERLSANAYDHDRIHYIIDSDHDRFLGKSVRGPDIFVTDFYSVESYLYCPGLFAAIFRQFASVEADDPVLGEAEALFESLDLQFSEYMAEPMATAIVLRRIGGPDSLHFDKVELHRSVRIVDLKLEPQQETLSSQVVSRWNGKLTGSVTGRIRRLATSLAKRDPRLWVRGKFHSYWFVRCFNEIAKHVEGNIRDKNGQTISCSLKNYGQRQFIPICKMHAVCPPKFREFVVRRFAQ